MFSSSFTRLIEQSVDEANSLQQSAETVSLKEQTQQSSMVRARSAGVLKTLRQARRVGDSRWVMVFSGFEYALAKPESGVTPARWSGIDRSFESAFDSARKWSVSVENLPAFGANHAFGTRATGPWGIGVAVSPIPDQERIKEKVLQSLELMARSAALRGLALASGLENRETVQANIIGDFKIQSYEDLGRLRVFALISNDQVQDLRTSGAKIGDE
jgi:hypothetical protein